MKSSKLNNSKALQKDNSKTIKKLQDELELYDMNIEADAEDHNSYYMKAKTLVKLGTEKQDSSYYKEALESYRKAIEIAPEEALYPVDRAKLYINNLGETYLALQDIRKLQELPESEGITGVYIKNTLRDIGKLDSIQSSIKQLLAEGKIDSELAAVLSDNARATSGLVVESGVRDKPDTHDNAQNNERIERLESLVTQLREGKEVADREILKLKADTEDAHKKLKLHGRLIADIKKDLNLVNEVTLEMQKKVDSGGFSNAEQEQMKKDLADIQTSMRELIEFRGASEEDTKKIIEEMTELASRKDTDTKMFLNLNKKIKGLEAELKSKANKSDDEVKVVMLLNEIVYDNELLNHPKLFKDAAAMFGFDEALELGNRLNKGAIVEAVNKGDSMDMLGVLLSLENDSQL